MCGVVCVVCVVDGAVESQVYPWHEWQCSRTVRDANRSELRLASCWFGVEGWCDCVCVCVRVCVQQMVNGALVELAGVVCLCVCLQCVECVLGAPGMCVVLRECGVKRTPKGAGWRAGD